MAYGKAEVTVYLLKSFPTKLIIFAQRYKDSPMPGGFHDVINIFCNLPEMRQSLVNLLAENGYKFKKLNSSVVITKKIVQSVGVLVICFCIGSPLFLFGLFGMNYSSSDNHLIGVITVLGIIFLNVPFFPYYMASYRGLVIDRNARTLLFRSARSRAYKFSEVESIELYFDKKYSETNAFSDSNREYTYQLRLLFTGHIKEELLKIVSRKDIKSEIEELRDYFQEILTE